MMATYTSRLSHENCEKHNMQHPNADKGTAIKAKVMVTTSLEIAQKVAASWYIVVCLVQVFFFNFVRKPYYNAEHINNFAAVVSHRENPDPFY